MPLMELTFWELDSLEMLMALCEDGQVVLRKAHAPPARMSMPELNHLAHKMGHSPVRVL